MNSTQVKATKVVWSAEDVQEEVKALDQTLTSDQAVEFLNTHAGEIQDSMIDAGWECITALLEEEYK